MVKSGFGLGRLSLLAVLIAAPAAAQDAPAQPVPPTTAAPAPTPITDLLTRMDALEAAIARLTAQNEELGNRQRQIEERLSATPAAATPPPAVTAPPPAASANASNLSAMTGGAEHGEPAHAAPPEQASAERVAEVKAVIKPQSSDAALDEYSYGFRLYTAKLYPEAVQQLKLYLAKYPHDAHVSQARNLLGRAYLDDGKPRDAAPWFLTNYKSDPHGARAADSLLNLATAMRAMNDQTRSCIALNEFSATYPDEAQGRLAHDYARAKSGLTCN